MKFEWNEQKNKANIQKHGISFEQAVYVFSDKNALSIFDDGHSENEDRWITLGLIFVSKMAVVVHTYREKNGKECIRIISARKATKNEMFWYFEKEGG